MPRPKTAPTDRLLNRVEVMERLQLKGHQSIYNWIKAGAFPPPLKIGPGKHAARWRESDLNRWIAAQRVA